MRKSARSGMSAHGDYEDMSQWLAARSNRCKLFLVHGEYDVQQAFQNLLFEKDLLMVPEIHSEVGI
jgi:metallo-beta-lactamase family protein